MKWFDTYASLPDWVCAAISSSYVKHMPYIIGHKGKTFILFVDTHKASQPYVLAEIVQ